MVYDRSLGRGPTEAVGGGLQSWAVSMVRPGLSGGGGVVQAGAVSYGRRRRSLGEPLRRTNRDRKRAREGRREQNRGGKNQDRTRCSAHVDPARSAAPVAFSHRNSSHDQRLPPVQASFVLPDHCRPAGGDEIAVRSRDRMQSRPGDTGR